MILSATDDGLVHTHDDASALLRYAVPGAEVSIYEPRLRHWAQRNSPKSRAYSITVRRFGGENLCVVGSYGLPANADQLVSHAVKQVREAAGE